VRRPIPIEVRVEPARRPSFEDRLRELRRPLQALDASAAGRQFELPDGATLLKTTLSLCPECLAHVQAAVYRDAGKVFMSKRCPTHGLSRALLEKHKLDHCTIQPEPEREEQLITIGRKAEPA